MFSILDIVNKSIVSLANKDHRDNTHFHPSSWDKCHRKIAYEYYESKGYIEAEQSTISPQTQRIFDNGHYLHYRWRSYIEEAGILMGHWECTNWSVHQVKPMVLGLDQKLGILKPDKCECGCNRFEYQEVGFYDEETWWGGHVDAILDLSSIDLTYGKKPDTPVVVDFKSINPYSFKKLVEPLPSHQTQIQIYLYLSGLTIGKVVYEDKGNQSVKEYLVMKDDSFLAVKKQEALRLREILSYTNGKGQRVLPSPAYSSRGHEECLNCKYRVNCWGE